jgi:pimeloyl-ACP methyl ester carboxylesterase
MEHLTIRANGASLHAVRTGRGGPLLLLHGWPEFWLTWLPVMDRLGESFQSLDLSPFEGVGHFPHREVPDRAAAEISGFFARIGHG